MTWLILPLTFGLIGGILTWRYASRRVREAEELERQGWRCIGVHLIGGPIMVPPGFPFIGDSHVHAEP